jgi:hypothetical protein
VYHWLAPGPRQQFHRLNFRQVCLTEVGSYQCSSIEISSLRCSSLATDFAAFCHFIAEVCSTAVGTAASAFSICRTVSGRFQPARIFDTIFQSGRFKPIFSIRANKVLGFTPKSSATPSVLRNSSTDRTCDGQRFVRPTFCLTDQVEFSMHKCLMRRK